LIHTITQAVRFCSNCGAAISQFTPHEVVANQIFCMPCWKKGNRNIHAAVQILPPIAMDQIDQRAFEKLKKIPVPALLKCPKWGVKTKIHCLECQNLRKFPCQTNQVKK
jgi:hypothetical protein